MLKSNELRINNWVNDLGSIPFQVMPDDIVALHQSEIANKINLGYNAIPLTEEWLEKLGLIKKFIEDPMSTGKPIVMDDDSRWYHWVDGGVFNVEIQQSGDIWMELYSHYLHVKHVHQLQNVYFALTGEELTLNPDGK